MPDLGNMAALDVLIGLFFLYFLLSVVCSAINEAISQLVNLRAHDLRRGIRNLLAHPEAASDVRKRLVKSFYGNRRIQALYKPKIAGVVWRRRPSYIPSRTFALAVLDTFAPPSEGVPSRDLIRRAQTKLKLDDEKQDDDPAKLPAEVRALLRDALDEARWNVDTFRTSLERSFNEVMDRTSGWYKRRVQIILFFIGLALVTAMNADTFAVANRLWKDDALRAAVAQQAQRQANVEACAKEGQPTTDKQPTNAVDRAAQCIDRVEELGLPIGWPQEARPSNEWGYGDWGGKILGLLVTAFALTLGAPFWFDLLGKVSRLRSTGPRELPTSQEGRSASAPEQSRPTA